MNDLLTAKPRVLVVDNEPMSRTLIDAVLRTGDRYDVLTASDGVDGLQIARRVRPDLMLLNAVMPGGTDGFSVCRTLSSATRNIPRSFIATTWSGV